MENPLFPDSREIQEQLIAGLRANPRKWKELTKDQQSILRDADPVPCPVCGRLYSFYDSRQGELKYYCRRACKDKAQIKYEQQCPFPKCGYRVISRRGLERHRQSAHADIPIEQFADLYVLQQGKIPRKHCEGCGVKLEPNILYGGYKPCRCIFTERKIEKTKQLIAECTDPDEVKRLKRSLGGLNSVLKKMRGIKKLKKSQLKKQKPQLPTQSQDLLMADAQFFRGLLNGVQPVYDAYDDMMKALNGQRRVLKDKNERLLKLVAQYGFGPAQGLQNGCYLYVAACNPEEIDSPSPSAQFFVKRIEYSMVAYQQMLSEAGMLSLDDKGLVHDLPVGHSCPDRPELQCWYRFLACQPDGQSHLLTPFTLLKIKEKRVHNAAITSG